MAKLEKYYNLIVDDLVKNTKMDIYNRKLTFPFTSTLPTQQPLSKLSYFFSFSPFCSHFFSDHIKERYGVRHEEVKIIWEQYKDRILTFYK